MEPLESFQNTPIIKNASAIPKPPGSHGIGQQGQDAENIVIPARMHTLKNDMTMLQNPNESGVESETEKLIKSIPVPPWQANSLPSSVASFPEPQEWRARSAEEPSQDKLEQITALNPFITPAEERAALEQKNKAEMLKNMVSPLQTFTSDVAQEVKTAHTSMATIVTAENERKLRTKKEGDLNNTGKNVLIISISLLLLCIAAAAGYYFLLVQKSSTAIPSSENTGGDILQAEKQSTFSLTNIDHNELLQGLGNTVTSDILPAGTIDHVTMTVTNNNITTAAMTPDLFALLQSGASDSLIRSLNGQFYLGIYNETGTNQPFLIFTTNSYSDTVAGMFSWEKTIIRDLQNVFLQPANRLTPPLYNQTEAELSASSTPGTAGLNASSTNPYVFKDAVVDNKNVRLVRDGQGNILFLYSMIDQNTLIITTDQFTFQELLNRLVKATFVR